MERAPRFMLLCEDAVEKDVMPNYVETVIVEELPDRLDECLTHMVQGQSTAVIAFADGNKRTSLYELTYVQEILDRLKSKAEQLIVAKYSVRVSVFSMNKRGNTTDLLSGESSKGVMFTKSGDQVRSGSLTSVDHFSFLSEEPVAGAGLFALFMFSTIDATYEHKVHATMIIAELPGDSKEIGEFTWPFKIPKIITTAACKYTLLLRSAVDGNWGVIFIATKVKVLQEYRKFKRATVKVDQRDIKEPNTREELVEIMECLNGTVSKLLHELEKKDIVFKEQLEMRLFNDEEDWLARIEEVYESLISQFMESSFNGQMLALLQNGIMFVVIHDVFRSSVDQKRSIVGFTPMKSKLKVRIPETRSPELEGSIFAQDSNDERSQLRADLMALQEVLLMKFKCQLQEQIKSVMLKEVLVAMMVTRCLSTQGVIKKFILEDDSGLHEVLDDFLDGYFQQFHQSLCESLLED
jgi:hypothetical protein